MDDRVIVLDEDIDNLIEENNDDEITPKKKENLITGK
jgi:hypothetical protein